MNEIKTMTTTIDRSGRVQLDQELQTRLGVQPGDEVILETRGNECILKPAHPKAGLGREGNVLVHRGVSAGAVEEAVTWVRDERLQCLGEGSLK